MGLILRYVVQTQAGTWHYRRRLPKEVAPIIGKGEFKRLLGVNERDALRAYPKVHGECERLIADARRRALRLAEGLTPLEAHREALRLARELATQRVYIGDEALSADDPEAADIARDSYLASFPIDQETGEPVGVPEVERRAIQILAHGGKVRRPSPTLEDGKRLYYSERIKGDARERQKSNQLELVMRHVVASGLEISRPLAALTREDGRNFRDYLTSDLGLNGSTASRYINVIRAVVNFGHAEFDLTDARNPFLNLLIRQEGAAVLERDPFPDVMLAKIRKRLIEHAAVDLQQIWRILEGTGCRLGEVTGLLVSDLRLDAPIPHIKLVPHPHRRLKTAGSARNVPLIGDALVAASEAAEAAGDGPFLFARYARERGSDAASAILMKHIRTMTDEPKVVVHSLRHRMGDRLDLAGVSKPDRNLILGHSDGGMSERYGSTEARLEVAARALKKAQRLDQ